MTEFRDIYSRTTDKIITDLEQGASRKARTQTAQQ
jgi:hypothetical protein